MVGSTTKETAMIRTALCLSALVSVSLAHGADRAASNRSDVIPWSEIGAKASADYKGDGLGVIASGTGARLQCVFQRLDGEATTEGLWLTSTTVSNMVSDRFRVTATEVR